MQYNSQKQTTNKIEQLHTPTDSEKQQHSQARPKAEGTGWMILPWLTVQLSPGTQHT